MKDPAAKPRYNPKHRASPAHPKPCCSRRTPPPPGAPSGSLPRRAAPSGERCRAGIATPGAGGGDFGPFPGAAKPGRGGQWRNASPRESVPRLPRRALTQHQGAEAPGHALGQVVHIELHGVQRQRFLHEAAGAAAGRQP